MNKIVSICSRMALAPLYYSLIKKVAGSENAPKRNFILAANHLSHLDWFIDGYFCTPRKFTFIGQIDKMTGLAGFLRDLMYGYAEVIPVNRKDSESRKQAFANALRRLKQGYTLIIYPEGTRSRDGQLHEFKPGVAKLHLESGAPILPVAHKGTYELMPPGGKLKIKKTVELTVGKPLDFAKERSIAAGMEKSSGEYRELCENIAKTVEDNMRLLLKNR
jgi:1-acyl-sn-glycerol-3-phosphate acyltransferase